MTTATIFYGFEMCIGTLSAVLVPLAVGLFVTQPKTGADGHSSYVIVAVVSLLLTLLAAMTLLSAKFERPLRTRFIYFDVHTVWRRMLGLAVLKGLMQGYMVTFPAILVLSFLGKEDKLGVVEACGSSVVAVCVYILGRTSGPAAQDVCVCHRFMAILCRLIGQRFPRQRPRRGDPRLQHVAG